MFKNLIVICFSGFLVVSCIETTTSTGMIENPPVEESYSSDQQDQNEQVLRDTLTDREKGRRERKLNEARARYTEDPTNEENIIWYGRRLAYLGKYNEAINIYNMGLNLYPESYRLLRHRGHRYITTRNFKQAIDDLQLAAFYAKDAPNAIEPDGIPNAYNKPLSNDKFNIWYHLGLAFYLNGNYDKAISAYKKCMEFSNNDDLKVATANWQYATYRKIGNDDAAEAIVEQIPVRMNLIENRVYHDLIMMYMGYVSPDLLLERNGGDDGNLNAAVGYGIGNFYLLNGNTERAIDMFNRILETDQWDSFGFIATEVEIELLNSAPF